MSNILITMPFVPTAHAHGHTGTDASITSHWFFQHNPPGSTVSGTLMALAILIAVGVALRLYYRQRHEKRVGRKDVTAVQNVAWAYAAMFFITTSLTYIPGLADESGNFVGLFKLDLIDDLLHFGSALWATFAAWHSTRQSTLYFRIFGSVYALDGIIGLATQRGILDFGVWLYEYPNLSLAANIGANLPHILIGSIALYAGFILSKKVQVPSRIARTSF